MEQQNIFRMITAHQISNPSYQNTVVSLLMMRNKQLVQDNMALADEVCRLRQMVTSYELQLGAFLKSEDYHYVSMKTIKQNTNSIIERIDKSDNHTTVELTDKINQLKKDMVFKRLQTLESKYEKKNQQCEQLLTFTNKIERLRSTWDLKNKDTSLDSLFIWVYNQIVKARGSALNKSKKIDRRPSQNKISKTDIGDSRKNETRKSNKQNTKAQILAETGFVQSKTNVI